MNKIDIYVATHKKQDLILPDYCNYIQVNAEKLGRWAGYIHDDDYADNYSKKNESYCELTALYALWKSSDADIKGLFHYRRFLSGKTQLNVQNEGHIKESKKDICKSIISKDRILELLEESDVILEFASAPFPLTAFEDLQKFVYVKDIWEMVCAIERKCPEYKNSLWEVLNSKAISYCNMFIANSSFVNEYCTWLFDLLKEMEEKININNYDKDHKRIYGYLAEVLLNIYIKKKKYKVKHVYRVDLLEENTYDKRKTFIKHILNSLAAVFGVYPFGASRKIFKARFLNNKENIERQLLIRNGSINNIASQVLRYLKECGCSNTSIIRHEGWFAVEASAIYATIKVIIVEKKACLYEILKEIDTERNKSPFGSTIACRVYCIEDIEDQLYDCLLKKGITVIKNS